MSGVFRGLWGWGLLKLFLVAGDGLSFGKLGFRVFSFTGVFGLVDLSLLLLFTVFHSNLDRSGGSLVVGLMKFNMVPGCQNHFMTLQGW